MQHKSVESCPRVNNKWVLVLAVSAATAVFACSPYPPMLTEAAATAVFARVPHPLVLADAATAAVFTPAPLPLVLAEAVPESLHLLFLRLVL